MTDYSQLMPPSFPAWSRASLLDAHDADTRRAQMEADCRAICPMCRNGGAGAGTPEGFPLEFAHPSGDKLLLCAANAIRVEFARTNQGVAPDRAPDVHPERNQHPAVCGLGERGGRLRRGRDAEHDGRDAMNWHGASIYCREP